MENEINDHRIPLHIRWNDTNCACDMERCVHWLFETQAGRIPHAPAVDDGTAVLSYAGLNARANQLAHHLRSRGIGRGKHVGVLMQRSCDLITAVLGILKSGAAYVPLEPAWPAERIRWAIAELQLDALLIDPSQVESILALRPHLPHRTQIVCVDQDQIGLLQANDVGHQVVWCRGLPIANPTRIAGPDDRAYVIFTSGSTGQPKAVAVRHRSVINLIDWVNTTFGVGSHDRILFTTSIAFDLSVFDIFGILAAGGAIRMATADENRDPELLAAILQREAITFWDSAPAAMERLLPFLQSSKTSSHLRLIFLSGDWIPLSLPTRLKSIFPSARFIALGGATEATVWSNFYEVNEIDPAWLSIPYGRPIQNVRYFILDGALQPCPVGVPGELYIAGACVAEGYANDSELTASRFIPNPLVRGDRLYRTGDRARYFPDGNIEFLGRADRQIKIRGFRVEPAEIESALQRHPLVQRAIVLAEGEDRTSKRLVAYVVLRSPPTPPCVHELREVVRRQLPVYMVPAEFHLLTSLPLTISGKPDMAAIREMTAPSAKSSVDAISAETETEAKLAKIWCSILRRNSIGIDDNFFDLGGDSLQAVQVIAAVAGMGLTLRLNDLLKYPTIRTLAKRCLPAEAAACIRERADDVPLTPTQHWFFRRPLRNPERYNMVFTFDIIGMLTAITLRRALAHLHQHHDALRLRFTCIAGHWQQSCDPAGSEPPLSEWDLSSFEQHEQDQQIEHRLATLRRQMNLGRGPLCIAVLVNRGLVRPQTLLVLFHHLLIDAVSLRIFAEDLNTAIEQVESGRAIVLPTSGSFADWAHRLQAFAALASALSEANYWLRLPWNKVRPLPKDCPSDANDYGSSRTLRARLSKSETRVLQHELPRRLGASVGEILLAACVQTLSNWAGCRTVLVDLTHHGRDPLFDWVSLARTVGYITRNVPILITVPPSASTAELCSTVHEHLCQMPACGVGLGVLRYMTPRSETTAALNRLPEAELKFNYIGSMMTRCAGLSRLRPVPSNFAGVLDPHEPRAYLHNLELAIVDERLQVEWKYSDESHREQTIRRLIDSYLTALRQLIERAYSEVESAADAAGATSGGPR